MVNSSIACFSLYVPQPHRLVGGILLGVTKKVLSRIYTRKLQIAQRLPQEPILKWKRGKTVTIINEFLKNKVFSGKHYFGNFKMAIFFVEVITWLIHGVCRRIPLTARRHYLAYRESGAIASLYITSSP